MMVNKSFDKCKDLQITIVSIITVINQQILQNVNQSWQTLANPANTVDYSSHILSATLPISIQHFLKYSETIKKESVGQPLNSGNILGSMDHSSGFNIKSDMMGLKNGIGSHGMNGMIHSGMNNHNIGLDSGNIVETTTSNPTTTKSGKKKKIKPQKVKTVRISVVNVYRLSLEERSTISHI